GLDEVEIKNILADPEAYKQYVDQDIQEAGQFGVTGVPFFIINRKYAISGAQPKAAFTQALEKVWQEENPVQTLTDLSQDGAAVCTDDNCEIPTDQTK